jgi:cytochrome c biogenesis protein CcdA/thiol-disulfide isomerase/thioredoxin
MSMVLAFALLAGVVTALSPCVLPVVPFVLASATGQARFRPLVMVGGLVVSFAVFTLVLARALVSLGLSASTLRLFALGALALLSVTLLWPALGERVGILLGQVIRRAPPTRGSGWIGWMLGGASLGLIWAPCAGPILAAVAVVAATEPATPAVAAVLAYGGRAVLRRTRWLAPRSSAIRRAFGGVALVTAAAVSLGLDQTAVGTIGWTGPLAPLETSAAAQRAITGIAPTLSRIPFTATVVPVAPARLALPSYGPAPEFGGILQWLNGPPRSLQSLRGQVVLVDFWTFDCFNCVNTLPYVKRWYATYHDRGFVVIGVHAPELAFEREPANVRDAVARYGIAYPVALDNDFTTWRAYQNQYWPAQYLVDAGGAIRFVHFGEGAYPEMEQAIQTLLAEARDASV